MMQVREKPDKKQYIICASIDTKIYLRKIHPSDKKPGKGKRGLLEISQ
jgi:hypothetical protein